jgi:hypothetical protein
MRPLVSGFLACPHAAFLLWTNKIFLTSAAGVCLCFHSESGSKNPEHLKFPVRVICAALLSSLSSFIYLKFPNLFILLSLL